MVNKKILGMDLSKWLLVLAVMSVFLIALTLGRAHLKSNMSQTSTQSLITGIRSQIAIHLKSSGDLLRFADLQKMFSHTLDIYEDRDGSYYLGAKNNSNPSLKIDGFIDPDCQTKARANDAIACVKLR